MFYCVLTGFIALLISGEAWVAFSTMAVAGLVVILAKSHSDELLNRYGGVKNAEVVSSVCYGNKNGERRYTQYTLMVNYRNGNKVRYTLSPEQKLYKALSPYIGKA